MNFGRYNCRFASSEFTTREGNEHITRWKLEGLGIFNCAYTYITEADGRLAVHRRDVRTKHKFTKRRRVQLITGSGKFNSIPAKYCLSSLARFPYEEFPPAGRNLQQLRTDSRPADFAYNICIKADSWTSSYVRHLSLGWSGRWIGRYKINIQIIANGC